MQQPFSDRHVDDVCVGDLLFTLRTELEAKGAPWRTALPVAAMWAFCLQACCIRLT